MDIHTDMNFVGDITFAVQKGSNLDHEISLHLLQLHEAGVIEGIVNKWQRAGKCSLYEHMFHVFPWHYVGGWLVIFGGTILCCVLILIAEDVYSYIRHKYRRQYIVNDDIPLKNEGSTSRK